MVVRTNGRLDKRPAPEDLPRTNLHKAVKSRLKSSRDTIERIAADCGWSNVNALRNAFLRVTGQTMRTFRVRCVTG